MDMDWPTADPKIRQDYETELGRLILAHNEVDYRLAQVIQLAACAIGDAVGRLEKLADGTFYQRITTFALLQAFRPELAGLDVERLQQLNDDRNKLAHGHMDQNPFDGSYEIWDRRTFQEKKKFPTDMVRRGREELELMGDRLRVMEALVCLR
jgi:hypothetical protein